MFHCKRSEMQAMICMQKLRTPKWIAQGGIETGRDHNEIGRECTRNGHQQPLKGLHILPIAQTCAHGANHSARNARQSRTEKRRQTCARKRNIDVESETATLTALVAESSARIESSIVGAMNGEEEHWA